VLGVLTQNRLDHVGRVEDILGLTIGYTTGTYISPFMRDDRIRFDFVSSGQPNEINVKKLLKGRIDCVYTPDKPSLLMELKNIGAEDLVKILDLPEAPGRVHVVFSKKNAALAKRFDAAFARINGDTRYLKLRWKYLDVSKL
jgi:ABC-type amino acid transport substrate-binding protein